MGFAYIYIIFGICAIAVSIGKALAVNFGISKYLSKKPYKGDFEFKKVALHTLKTNYILLTIIVLFVIGVVVCSISISGYLNILENIVELLLGFLVALAMSFLGPRYNATDNEYGAYVIPFFILVILSIPMLFFVNYKFVYKDFEVSKKVSKNKKWKLSFFTALANAPYELLIPYGQFGTMIFKNMI